MPNCRSTAEFDLASTDALVGALFGDSVRAGGPCKRPAPALDSTPFPRELLRRMTQSQDSILDRDVLLAETSGRADGKSPFWISRSRYRSGSLLASNATHASTRGFSAATRIQRDIGAADDGSRNCGRLDAADSPAAAAIGRTLVHPTTMRFSWEKDPDKRQETALLWFFLESSRRH